MLFTFENESPTFPDTVSFPFENREISYFLFMTASFQTVSSPAESPLYFMSPNGFTVSIMKQSDFLSAMVNPLSVLSERSSAFTSILYLWSFLKNTGIENSAFLPVPSVLHPPTLIPSAVFFVTSTASFPSSDTSICTLSGSKNVSYSLTVTVALLCVL